MYKMVLLPSSLFLLTSCNNISVLNPKSATGMDQAYLIWFSLGIMSIVILVVFILFTWFVIKYRSTPERRDVLPNDVKGNLKLELTYSIIPFVLLLILAIPTIKITMEQSPSTEAKDEIDGIHINVIAKQFEWSFEHPNGKEVVDQLVIPEGETIIFHLRSEDVIHSFWVPELAGKVDVLPNKELTYVINDPVQGAYDGKCAEFCGIQHQNMIFDVEVVDKEDYDAYLNDASEGAKE